MLEKRKDEDDEDNFFDLDNPIEDEYYKGIKKLIKCSNCDKIVKDPMMCKECQASFCKKCIEETNEQHKCKEPSFIENVSATFLLKNLKYLCQNCKVEVKQEQIEKHLDEGCASNDNPTKLYNEIYRTKQLETVSKDEIKKLPEEKKDVNHITCKISFYYKFLFF